jgi:hypothetical protein
LAHQRSSAINFLILPMNKKTPQVNSVIMSSYEPLDYAVVEQRMPQTHRITILIPLVVGTCGLACTIFIRAGCGRDGKLRSL